MDPPRPLGGGGLVQVWVQRTVALGKNLFLNLFVQVWMHLQRLPEGSGSFTSFFSPSSLCWGSESCKKSETWQERTADDPLCRVTYPLKSLPVCIGAAGIPDCDAVCRQTFHGKKAAEDRRQLVLQDVSPRHPQEVKTLLCLRCSVCSPHEISRDDGSGGIWMSGPSLYSSHWYAGWRGSVLCFLKARMIDFLCFSGLSCQSFQLRATLLGSGSHPSRQSRLSPEIKLTTVVSSSNVTMFLGWTAVLVESRCRVRAYKYFFLDFLLFWLLLCIPSHRKM